MYLFVCDLDVLLGIPFSSTITVNGQKTNGDEGALDLGRVIQSVVILYSEQSHWSVIWASERGQSFQVVTAFAYQKFVGFLDQGGPLL